jgi:hypothetical protein
MISLNSLAAFTQEVTRSSGIQPVRGPAPSSGSQAPRTTAGPAPQRPLEQVPPQPATALPRGSLLDLRV